MNTLRTALPALCLCMAPLLTAADCPSALGGGQPHHGDWVADVPGGVAFYRFDSNGEVVYTTEVYSSSRLVDEMKLELQATCTRPEGSEPEADGTYRLRCVDERATRASEGVGATINAVNAFGDVLGATRTMERTLEVRRDGARLVVTRLPNKRKDRARTYTFEPTDRGRADAFLERFREGTTLITESTTTTREKDLP